MRTEPVYRLKAARGGLEIGPVLGLLLGNRNHWYDGDFLGREPERVDDVYRTAGGLVCAFSPRNLSLMDRCAYGLYYDPNERRWRFGTLPIPTVIHRRSFSNHPAMVEQLQKFGVRVFNSWRYSKWELYNILSQDETIRRHLPDTVLIRTGREVAGMLDRHNSVIIKPTDLSRGRGIVFLERRGQDTWLYDCRAVDPPESRQISRDELEAMVRTLVTPRPHLCQQRLDLATVDGARFDVRVVMQRDTAGRWQCTGIECRVAGHGCFLTNVSRGGKAMWLSEAITKAFGDKMDPFSAGPAIIGLCDRVCTVLDKTGKDFAEFGMDVTLDKSGRSWFIEANVIPTFHGFQAMDYETYRRILAAPLLYASHLVGFGEKGLSTDWGEDSGTTIPFRRVIGPSIDSISAP
jgi:glutathione synthase/RimK-type ligase-like ATP-grasp enzyme